MTNKEEYTIGRRKAIGGLGVGLASMAIPAVASGNSGRRYIRSIYATASGRMLRASS